MATMAELSSPGSNPHLTVERVKMSRYTTLGVGGEAEMWRVGSVEALQEAMQRPWRMLGGGSNLIVADEGLSERVIRLAGPLAQLDLRADTQLSEGEDIVTDWIGAGVALPPLLKALAKLGWSGLEGTAGFPAQIGGAVYMNAGTAQGWMHDGLHSVELVSASGIRVLSVKELGGTYRNGNVPAGSVVSRVRLALKQRTPEEVSARLAEVEEKRKHQPKNRTPGCAFKNPDAHNGAGAGKLIDEAGLKGLSVGGAMISREHANFIVNTGGATAADVLELLFVVREKMRELGHFFELEYEIWPESAAERFR